jgi:hypothetical protein
MTDLVTWLGWICYADAAFAIVIYGVHFAGRQGWRRPWNAAGLFFTAIAMTQAPTLMQEAEGSGSLRSAVILTLCLLAATGLQAVTAMRRRKRREDAPAPGDAA